MNRFNLFLYWHCKLCTLKRKSSFTLVIKFNLFIVDEFLRVVLPLHEVAERLEVVELRGEADGDLSVTCFRCGGRAALHQIPHHGKKARLRREVQARPSILSVTRTLYCVYSKHDRD